MQVRCVFSCSARLLISFTSLLASDLCLSTCMQKMAHLDDACCNCGLHILQADMMAYEREPP